MNAKAVAIVVLAAVGFTIGCGSPSLQITVTRSTTLTPASGVVLISAIEGPLQAFATDLNGKIVWKYSFDSRSGQFEPLPIQLLPNGHMLIVTAHGDGIGSCSTCGTDNLIREIDLAGNTLWQLTNQQLQQELTAAGYNITIAQMSHDALALPNGHIIVVLSDLKDFTGLAGQTGTTAVEGGALVDLDANHNPVWVWDAFDHLEVNRHPYFQLPDWIHGNAVIYSPDDGDLIFSSRAQSWVMKIDYRNGSGTGDMVWRLGYQGDFNLSNGGPADWFYGQHAPVLLSPNSTGVFKIGVFDNGNGRVLDTSGAMCGAAGQSTCHSTVPIYEVDEANRTATVVWRDTLPFFSSSVGNMQVLDNGDVWFDAGSVNGMAETIAREVTMDSNPQTVLEMDINRRAYRAVHMPSLDSGVQ